MKAHDGEILNDLLIELGFKKSKLAAMLGMHRNSITNFLSYHTISDEKLLQIGDILKYDMSLKFERLKRYYQTPSASEPVDEPLAGYGKGALQKCYDEVDYWRKKAFENMEMYNSLLVEYKNRFAQQP